MKKIYNTPELKTVELSSRSSYLNNVSITGSSPQNEQMDDNADGFGDDFWNS